MSAWYDKISEQAQPSPEFQIEGMDYCGADGGNPSLYAGRPDGIWSMIRGSWKSGEATAPM